MVKHPIFSIRITFLICCITCIAFGQIVIIVHPENPIADISREDLEHLYNGSLTTFSDGTPVTLVEHHPTAEVFYQILLNKSYIKIKKQWIRYVFSGRTASPPVEISDDKTLQEYVLTHRGAIAFFPVDEITTNVKILTVDKYPFDHEKYLFAHTGKSKRKFNKQL